MAILIDTKKKKANNVIYFDDYRRKKGYTPFSDELAKLNRDIAAYNKEAEEASKELKAKLFSTTVKP